MKKIHKIQDLEQVRLLTDPLKLQILGAFAQPRTTKDVASELGESVTTLYRHVDALHDAGLLEVVSEQQKRGTVERTFRAIAERFEADHGLFLDENQDEGIDAAREMLRVCEGEILGLVANPSADLEQQAIIMRVLGRVSPEKFEELKASLQAWLDSLPGEHDAPTESAINMGGLIAFYQLD